MNHPCKTELCFKITFYLSLLLLLIIPIVVIPKFFNSININQILLQSIIGIILYTIMSFTFIKYWKVFPCNEINIENK